MILELLQKLSAQSQIVMIFEDIHWMDSLSWSLLADVAASVHPLLMVISHRLWIDDAPPPTEYTELVNSGRGFVHSLSGVTREDSAQLTCRCLRCDEIPEVIMSIVINRARCVSKCSGMLLPYSRRSFIDQTSLLRRTVALPGVSCVNQRQSIFHRDCFKIFTELEECRHQKDEDWRSQMRDR